MEVVAASSCTNNGESDVEITGSSCYNVQIVAEAMYIDTKCNAPSDIEVDGLPASAINAISLGED